MNGCPPAHDAGDTRRGTIRNVQALRFLAALGVATSHIADRLIPHGPANRWFWSIPWTAGVDLFFVISGFIMLLLAHGRFGHPGAALEFLKRRAIRIVPPYWFFTTLTVVLVLLAGGRLKGTTIDWAQALASYAFLPWPRADGAIVPIVSQGWTLNYEMAFYAMVAAALTLRRGGVVLCLAFPLIVASHAVWPQAAFVPVFWSDPIILEFLAGMGLARLYLAGHRLSHGGSVAVMLAGIALFVALLWGHFGALDRPVQCGIPATLIAAAAILAPQPPRLGPIGRFVRIGGDASYALYLSHYLIVNAVALVWRHLGLGMPWIGVAAGLGCAVAVAILFHLQVERPVADSLRKHLTYAK